MEITRKDCDTLRSLASKLMELAGRPIETEKRQLWLDHNALKPTRPLIVCDPENGWREIITQESLVCDGDLARSWEWSLRRDIFWGETMGDDRIVPTEWSVGHVATDSGWGLAETRTGGHDGGAYTWDAPLKSYDQLSELRFPTLTIDWDASNKLLAEAHDVFDGIWPVRVRSGWMWTTGLTSTLALIRGLEQLMIDMIDDPDNLHRIMAFLRDGTLARLHYLEDNNLLSLNNDGVSVGSGGVGLTDQLPGPGFDGRVRLSDLWGLSESQETVSVSPDMFAEFVLPYQMPIVSLFGLSCYGCCEPLDKRWKHVKTIPNLRRVSVSPWADRAVMAANLEDRYVYSMKPNPADLAMDGFDADRIRTHLRADLQAAKGCHVEVIMKDCHTIRRDPRRVVDWVRIARDEAERV
ncbi:MAG TPA: hypothetical protein VGK19_13280 [Capsulimonadaceae bacterium]|jgi:hypothetical protein